jgi:heptosyltransferase-1
MRVLVVKTSSLGDVVHALPALTDAQRIIPEIKFDWVVEEAFAPIPSWHNAVIQVIPVALRRWRKHLFTRATYREWREFKHRIEAANYDLVIDSQGLLKSALLASRANGSRHGFDKNSVREKLAACSYQHRHPVDPGIHAIDRQRELFARALGYDIPEEQPDYGIFTGDTRDRTKSLVFLHGTTWPSKHWPENYWHKLVKIVTSSGYRVLLPWGNPAERERANRLASDSKLAEVVPPKDLNGIAEILSSATGAVAVDTGLGHLAAAFSVPTVSLYGSTNPALTGTRGRFQEQLAVNFDCAPCLRRECNYHLDAAVEPACYQTLQPDTVWVKLQHLIKEKETVS